MHEGIHHVSRQHLIVTESTEEDQDQLAQLAASLSRRLTRVPLDDMAAAIAEALAEIGAVTRVEGCQLLEFTESAAVARVHFRLRHRRGNAGGRPPPEPGNWLVERLWRGELVSISRPEELPGEAVASRAQSRTTGANSILGVPAACGGRVICALVVDCGRLPSTGRQLFVERLQLLADVLARGAAARAARDRAARQRHGHRAAQRPARSRQRLLKEEIKSYHDFDDIVGESAPLRLALARLSQVAPTNSSVLLLGPTGTGKELFARALHERSRRHRASAGARQLRRAAAVARRERIVRP